MGSCPTGVITGTHLQDGDYATGFAWQVWQDGAPT